jgi:hypothetical protein
MLTETEPPFNIPKSLSVAFAKGHFRLLQSTLSKMKSLKFRFVTHNNNNNNDNNNNRLLRAKVNANLQL